MTTTTTAAGTGTAGLGSLDLDRGHTLGALLAFIPAYFSWSGLALCLLLHWLTGGIGICMTYHRLLTHRSFAVRPRWLEYVMTILGACASEGGPIGWVADHRKHHAHSDEEDDTHTPLRGFLWAHMCWWMKVGERLGAHTRVLPEVVPRPLQRPGPSLARALPLRVSALAVCGVVRTRRHELAGLGRVRPIGLRAPFDLAGQFGEPRLGLSLASDSGQVDELVVGRAADLRRRLAQQPPRLPDVRPPRLRWWEVDMTYLAIRVMKICRIAYNIRLPKIRSVDAHRWR